MIALSNIILEMTARGADLQETVDRLCVEIERMAPGVLCSVLIVDAEGRLRPLAAPHLPAAFSQGLDGMAIGPDVGSCGTAAWERRPIFVRDIDSDPRWNVYRAAAQEAGLRSCWSTPVFGEGGDVIGTFALYARDVRDPTTEERAIVDVCVHLCSIAIERHRRVQDRERRANLDGQTGLGNRAAFNAELNRLSCDCPGAWAILILDLDNLKVVNDGFGHHAGDMLIQAAARRIAQAAAPDRAFRIGGDEFAMIIEHRDALCDIDRFAGAILTLFEEPHDWNGHAIPLRASIGGAILAAGDLEADVVRRNADFALYHAKETGRGRFVRYWPGIDTRIIHRIAVIRDVDAALCEGRIEAFYQPIVDLETRRIVAMEALCRLRMHDGAVMVATTFREAMVDVQIAGRLTRRMLEIVAHDMRDWIGQGIALDHVALNVSPGDLLGGALDQQIAQVQALHGLPLDRLVIEIPEGAWSMLRDSGAIAVIDALRATGVRIGLDDFGTGGGMLMSLVSMPMDVIKIDRILIDKIPSDKVAGQAAALAVIDGLLQAARDLDIIVIAEGVENEAQALWLARKGCTLAQGHFFSKPLNRDDATMVLVSNRAERNVGIS